MTPPWQKVWCRTTGEDLKRIAIAAIIINFLLLAIFLRALVAPIYLLASSLLALTAAMGLTTFVFQDLAGGEGLTFYVPFAASVLLIALGSDYNIFGVGHVMGARHEISRCGRRSSPQSPSRREQSPPLASPSP